MSEHRQLMHALSAISHQLMYIEQRIISIERMMKKPLSELLAEITDSESEESTASAPATFRRTRRQ